MNENKARGGYYTPDLVADFLSAWAVRDKNDLILEPSCGDGRFLCAIQKQMGKFGCPVNLNSTVDAVEIMPAEAVKASAYGVDVVNADFFAFYEDRIVNRKKYSVVLGNPPFVRHRMVDRSIWDKAAKLVGDAGVAMNKLSNLWLPFLILSCEALDSETGRLGMVIPSDLLQAAYAASARKYLVEKFDSLTILTFNKLVFKGVGQDVVLLLGQMKSRQRGISVLALDKPEDLLELDIDQAVKNAAVIDPALDRWTTFCLTQQEMNLLRKMDQDRRIVPATELFEVNVGMTTGANSFFLLSQNEVQKRKLTHSVRKCVAKSNQLSGVVFSEHDFEEVSQQQKQCWLFQPGAGDLTQEEQAYIEAGEKAGICCRYKCRSRKKWYLLPESWQPEAFVMLHVHLFCRIVLNQAGVVGADSLGKIRFLAGVNKEHVTSAFLNSYTLALSELTGCSYGGGLLQVVPGAIRRLKIPWANADRLDISIIDKKIRAGDLAGTLDYVDEILLVEGLGLSKEEAAALRRIWLKLQNRRLHKSRSE